MPYEPDIFVRLDGVCSALVFSEYHAELLEVQDSVFEQGNVTTHAVTKLVTEQDRIRLEVDIRYAIDAHEKPWDGKTEGLVKGKPDYP